MVSVASTGLISNLPKPLTPERQISIAVAVTSTLSREEGLGLLIRRGERAVGISIGHCNKRQCLILAMEYWRRYRQARLWILLNDLVASS